MVRQMLFLHFFMSLFMRLHCDSRKAVCSGANLSQRMYRPVSRHLTNLWQIRSVNWVQHFSECLCNVKKWVNLPVLSMDLILIFVYDTIQDVHDGVACAVIRSQ